MQFIIATQSFPFFPFQLFAKKMSTFVLNIKPGDSISNDQSSFDKQTNLLHNSINYNPTTKHSKLQPLATKRRQKQLNKEENQIENHKINK